VFARDTRCCHVICAKRARAHLARVTTAPAAARWRSSYWHACAPPARGMLHQALRSLLRAAQHRIWRCFRARATRATTRGDSGHVWRSVYRGGIVSIKSKAS